MSDTNMVCVIGRLTRDGELKYLASGLGVMKFSIANNYRKKDGDKWTEAANFFDVVIYGKAGEVIRQYLVKGKQVCVTGELRQSSWEKDGERKTKIEIIGNNVQLLGGDKPASRSEPQEPSAEEPFADDISF